MSDAPAGPGWWQASDGRWYPPDARQVPDPNAGWWQASDGRWYPPTARPGTPPPSHQPAPGGPVAPATPIVSAPPGRAALAPAGEAPPADDVAPEGTPVGDLLIARSSAAAASTWLADAGSTLARAEQEHGQDPSAITEVADPAANVGSELPRVLDQLAAGPAQLDDLQRRRAAATQDLEQAESAKRAARTKAVGVAVVVVVLLILVLVVL